MERKYNRSRLSISSAVQIALLGLMMAFTFATPLISPARAATTHDVSIIDYQFVPATITIAPGDSIRWTNNGAVPHTSTSDTGSADPWDSGNLNAGQSFTRQFNTIGSFGYHCTYHTFMTATITVAAIPEFSNVAFVMIGLMVLVLGISVFFKKK